MDYLRHKPFHFSVIFSLVGVLFLAVTALYLSGTLQSINTAINKPKASSLQPAITETFIDNFKDGSIDQNKWIVVAPAGTGITEVASDNLRFDIASGSASKQAQLAYKDVLKDKADFRVDVVAYRPVVTGTGLGGEGIRFSSAGATDKEGAVIRWVVNGSSSTIHFVVTDKNGTVKVNKSETLVTNVAILRLVRVNTEYRAMYKAGNDYSSDLNWNALGVCDDTAATGNCSSALEGQDGRLALFANNNSSTNAFPKVVGRFDTVRIGWEIAPTTGTPSPKPPPTTTSFSDAFSNGNLGTKWKTNNGTGVTATETATDNLRITIPAATIGRAILTRSAPVLGVEKDFTYNAAIFKPAITGDGTGFSGIAFSSTSGADKEGASIRWYVSKNGTTTTSRLVFSVSDRTGGTPVEKAGVVVTNSKLTISLRRANNTYRAWYRVGDGDADWIQIGTVAAEDTLGADGRLQITASNTGLNNKFPRIIARFDRVSASIEK